MNTKILAVASTVAILAASQAFADTKHETEKKYEQPAGSGSIQTDAKKAWEEIKEDTSEAAEDLKTYFLGNEENGQAQEVVIVTRKTANGMIGQAVQNANNERVGTVKDIILDSSGKAQLIIIADGEFPGIDGKLVAMNYDFLSNRSADGDLMAPLTEASIDKATAFSYDVKDRSDKVAVLSDEGISVASLLEGQLVDEQMQPIGEVDNISLKNGQASDIVVGFDKILGVGGEKLALGYAEAKLIRVDGGFDFQLSANQAAQFEAYKKASTN